MKIYKNIEDWKKDWTDEKQKLFHETKERKYGKSSDDSMMLIDDKELSEITGAVRFTIPVKNTNNITVNVEPKAVIDTELVIYGYGRLPIKIIGDFTDIPEKHHEIFMMAMLGAFPQKAAKVKPSKPKEIKSFGEWFFDALFFKTNKK